MIGFGMVVLAELVTFVGDICLLVREANNVDLVMFKRGEKISKEKMDEIYADINKKLSKKKKLMRLYDISMFIPGVNMLVGYLSMKELKKAFFNHPLYKENAKALTDEEKLAYSYLNKRKDKLKFISRKIKEKEVVEPVSIINNTTFEDDYLLDADICIPEKEVSNKPKVFMKERETKKKM